MELSTHTSVVVSGSSAELMDSELSECYQSIRQIFNLESSPDDVADKLPRILNIEQSLEHFPSIIKCNKQHF